MRKIRILVANHIHVKYVHIDYIIIVIVYMVSIERLKNYKLFNAVIFIIFCVIVFIDNQHILTIIKFIHQLQSGRESLGACFHTIANTGNLVSSLNSIQLEYLIIRKLIWFKSRSTNLLIIFVL